MTEFVNNTNKKTIHLTRFQSEILAIGYRVVMYKSKFKKHLYHLKKLFTLFNI